MVRNNYQKIYLFSLMLIISALAFSACASDSTTSSTTSNTTSEEEKTFTLEELAQYDGQDGRPAYITVDGVVYDVSDIPQWRDGIHQGRFAAGQDYSEEIRSESPHGTSMLSRADVVGVLVD